MKNKISSILKKIIVIVGILFLCTLLIKGINTLVYKSVVPPRYKTACWEGIWQNSETSFISGKILVDLPYHLPINKDTNIDMMVYYNLWCLYIIHWKK